MAVGVAFSDVSSQNVVGFQNLNFTPGDYTFSAQTFGKVGGGITKLSEFKPVSAAALTAGNFGIIFFKRDGSQRKVVDDTWLTETYENHEALLKDATVSKGIVRFWFDPSSQNWYLFADNRKPYKFIMNDYPIKQTDGYQVFFNATHGADAHLVYSGEVADAALELDVTPGDYVFSGNVAPADMKLSEFTPVTETGLTAGNFGIVFFKRDGSQRKVVDDTWLTETYENHEALVKDATVSKGIVRFWFDPSSQNWYLFADNRKPYKFIMNDYPIKAGQGFQVFASSAHTGGFQLLLPPAIEKDEK